MQKVFNMVLRTLQQILTAICRTVFSWWYKQHNQQMVYKQLLLLKLIFVFEQIRRQVFNRIWRPEKRLHEASLKPMPNSSIWTSLKLPCKAYWRLNENWTETYLSFARTDIPCTKIGTTVWSKYARVGKDWRSTFCRFGGLSAKSLSLWIIFCKNVKFRIQFYDLKTP